MMIGEKLKAVRKSKNLSQGDVEHKTGLLRCYVSRCENGHTVPSIETLEKWTRALGITMSQLFAEDGEPAPVLPALRHKPTAKLNREATMHLRQIESAFARMQPRDTALIAAMALESASAAA